MTKRSIVFGLTILIVLLGALFAYNAYLVHGLRQPVLAQLSDPDSAKFRNEKVRGGFTVSSAYLCGEVNGKNQMGGYIGYRKFWALKGKAADIETETLDAEYIDSQCNG